MPEHNFYMKTELLILLNLYLMVLRKGFHS